MISVALDIEELIGELREIVREELAAQGHRDSGKLSESMRIEVKETPDKLTALLWLEDYYVFIEYPMDKGRVPFSRSSGATFSQMVQNLMKWFRRKGAANPLSASFATINVWMKEGRPTKNSYRFSSNGRRTGFLKHSAELFSKDLPEKISIIYAEEAEQYYRAVFRSLDQFKIAG